MIRFLSAFLLAGLTSSTSFAFTLRSSDVKAGSTIGEDFVFQGMGCNGKNLSPEIDWSGAPKGTKSFAVTVYDPKAPTGSGWWHWIVVDIPAGTSTLKRGWKPAAGEGKEITSDFGSASYGGPCPPPGTPHPYIFSVHALNVKKIAAPEGASNAYVRFLIEAATLQKASFTAQYGRKK
jgi:Raf kinase inhibitor-like YbhB/YbcL family protein